jgi:hypothetical protein
MSARQNYMPNTISLFDSSGDDSVANKDMIIGSAGSIVQNSPVVVGAPNTKYSENNWYTNGYQYSNDISYQKYIDYIKARKDFTTLSGVITSASFPSNGIYTISDQDVVFDQTWFAGKYIVLVIDGGKKATFNTDFKPTGSVAVLASEIDINPSVTEIDAILIGQKVSTGTASNGLKIKGNLIDEESSMTIDRTQPNAHKPSLFVVFDVPTYLNVLPYLSTSTYDWKQVQ